MIKIFHFILKILVAVILTQTLFYKFSAHVDSVYIFTKVGIEPFGRIGIGILELIAAILILIPRTSWFGAVISIGVISGAILMHLSIIGIEVNNDNGLLFYLAVTVFILSLFILWNERKNIPSVNQLLKFRFFKT